MSGCCGKLRGGNHCSILALVVLEYAECARTKGSLSSSKEVSVDSSVGDVYYAFELIHAERAISIALKSNFSSHISTSSLSI